MMLTIPLVALMWLLRVVASALVVVSLLPLIRHGSWWVRGWDFPRLQLAAIAGMVAAGMIGLSVLLAVVAEGSAPGDLAWWLLVLLGVILWQTGHVWRYTRLWKPQVQPIEQPCESHADDRDYAGAEGPCFRLMSSNLDKRNTRYDQARAVFEQHRPDLLQLIEIHDDWAEGLAPLREHYPHRIEHITDDGLGIALWSRLELEDAKLVFPVSDYRASIHAWVHLQDGRRIRYIGTHPVPPGLRTGKWYERYDSRIRDAELLQLGKHIAEHPEYDWLIAGDFNDVAWSRTTRRFERISGLMDPRVGRTLLNTYHAREPMLRYPLDHVYVSPTFETGRLERVYVPDSDHFGVIADLRLKLDADQRGAEPDADAREHAEAEQIIREGYEDAEARGDREA
jgi:endonuclease/exonuclease/phosphatase (EEP) superfamily protein YafD